MFKLIPLSSRFTRNVIINCFLIFSLVFVSGCLVHPKTSKSFLRDTDQLHLYQNGDFIVYNVTGVNLTTTSSQQITGSMEVRWSALTLVLNDPNTGNLIPVTTNILKEITTLTINGAQPITTVRYISQDASGNVSLHAFDKDGSQSYWVDNTKTPDTTINMNPVLIATSPLVVNPTPSTTTYYVFDGCPIAGGGGCATPDMGNQSETITIASSDQNVRTDAGVFNTFSVNFSGSKLLDDSNLTAFPIELDIRSSCGLGNTNFNGTSYVYPQVGTVYMSVSCTNALNTEQYNYSYSFVRAGGSIVLPSPS